MASLRQRRILPLRSAGASIAECKALYAKYRRTRPPPGARPAVPQGRWRALPPLPPGVRGPMRKEIAAHLRLSTSQIEELVRRGVFPRSREAALSLEHYKQLYEEYLDWCRAELGAHSPTVLPTLTAIGAVLGLSKQRVAQTVRRGGTCRRAMARLP